VTVQTAGGGDGGDLHITGVREFEAIRDYLYARMRGVRHAGQLPGAKSGAAGLDRELLVELRDALRSAARALEQRREERS
jgi:putative membrane protein